MRPVTFAVAARERGNFDESQPFLEVCAPVRSSFSPGWWPAAAPRLFRRPRPARPRTLAPSSPRARSPPRPSPGRSSRERSRRTQRQLRRRRQVPRRVDLLRRSSGTGSWTSSAACCSAIPTTTPSRALTKARSPTSVCPRSKRTSRRSARSSLILASPGLRPTRANRSSRSIAIGRCSTRSAWSRWEPASTSWRSSAHHNRRAGSMGRSISGETSPLRPGRRAGNRPVRSV